MPLIVPPTTTKSSFFNNEAVRSQWVRAHFVLDHAVNVYFLGYSLPATDLMVRFMLSSLTSDQRVFVVNKVNPGDEDEVVRRYTQAVGNASIITSYVSIEDVMERFTSEVLKEAL